MRHLANAQYWDRPAGGNTGGLFLAFGGPVCTELAIVHWIGCINAIKFIFVNASNITLKFRAVTVSVKSLSAHPPP